MARLRFEPLLYNLKAFPLHQWYRKKNTIKQDSGVVYKYVHLRVLSIEVYFSSKQYHHVIVQCSIVSCVNGNYEIHISSQILIIII